MVNTHTKGRRGLLLAIVLALASIAPAQALNSDRAQLAAHFRQLGAYNITNALLFLPISHELFAYFRARAETYFDVARDIETNLDL